MRVGLVTRRRLLQSGLLVASGCACAQWAFCEGQHQDTEAGQSWNIGNGLIERVVAFEAGAGLFTRKFSSLSTHAEFMPPEKSGRHRSQEFSFLCNGQSCAGIDAAFDLLGAIPAALPNGHSLTVRLRHKDLPLEVAVVYSVYSGHPATAST